ncbi:MAG TPA: (d)CMP kinase [Erysipelothrix sp.]|nr:(d)CMP kinase [Erysipelothrix sp.]
MFNIGIDGPSASGKSTIAKELAKKLNFIHIDTGAMYRAIALDCLKNKVDLDDEKACVALANKSKIELLGDNQIFLNDFNVTQSIRSEKVSKAASKISQYKDVRHKLVELQQAIASKKGFVMDGRDITSVVLPDAEVKIYQNADVSVRAKRRFYELVEKGHKLDYQDVYDDLVLRDKNDMTRSESPLVKVDDAVEVDTTYLSIDESVELIMSIIKDRGLV